MLGAITPYLALRQAILKLLSPAELDRRCELFGSWARLGRLLHRVVDTVAQNAADPA